MHSVISRVTALMSGGGSKAFDNMAAGRIHPAAIAMSADYPSYTPLRGTEDGKLVLAASFAVVARRKIANLTAPREHAIVGIRCISLNAASAFSFSARCRPGFDDSECESVYGGGVDDRDLWPMRDHPTFTTTWETLVGQLQKIAYDVTFVVMDGSSVAFGPLLDAISIRRIPIPAGLCLRLCDATTIHARVGHSIPLVVTDAYLRSQVLTMGKYDAMKWSQRTAYTRDYVVELMRYASSIGYSVDGLKDHGLVMHGQSIGTAKLCISISARDTMGMELTPHLEELLLKLACSVIEDVSVVMRLDADNIPFANNTANPAVAELWDNRVANSAAKATVAKSARIVMVPPVESEAAPAPAAPPPSSLSKEEKKDNDNEEYSVFEYPPLPSPPVKPPAPFIRRSGLTRLGVDVHPVFTPSFLKTMRRHVTLDTIGDLRHLRYIHGTSEHIVESMRNIGMDINTKLKFADVAMSSSRRRTRG